MSMTLIPLNCHLKIFTPVNESLWPTQVLRRGLFYIEGHVMEVDLTPLYL